MQDESDSEKGSRLIDLDENIGHFTFEGDDNDLQLGYKQESLSSWGKNG